MFSQVEEIIKSWFLIDVIALSYERTDERHDKVLIRFLDTPIQYLIFFNENVQTTSWELQRTYYGNQFIWVHSVDLTALNVPSFNDINKLAMLISWVLRINRKKNEIGRLNNISSSR